MCLTLQAELTLNAQRNNIRLRGFSRLETFYLFG